MLTTRSNQLASLLPTIRAGVRSARLRSAWADDAVQQTLVALIPQLERLEAMTDRERAAYVFVAAARAAMAIRKRVGFQAAVGTDLEVAEWAKEVPPTPSPEHNVMIAAGALRVRGAFDALAAQDQKIVSSVVQDGLSEREVASQLGISRGNVAYRLRRARQALGRAWSGTTSWARKHGSGS